LIPVFRLLNKIIINLIRKISLQYSIIYGLWSAHIMATDSGPKWSRLMEVAFRHHQNCRTRGFHPADTLIASSDPFSGGCCRGLTGASKFTILANLGTAAGFQDRFRSGVQEATYTWKAQDNQDRIPEIETAQLNRETTLPGGAPLIDHLGAYLCCKKDWKADIKETLYRIQDTRIQSKAVMLQELVLGLSTDSDWDHASELLAHHIKKDADKGFFLQAADTEDFSVFLNWGVTANGFAALLTRIRGARECQRDSICFDSAVPRKSATQLPVRFFIGGSDWQIQIRLPVRLEATKNGYHLHIRTNTTICEGERRFFKQLPVMVGFGISTDILQLGKVMDTLWGENLFRGNSRLIEFDDLLHLAGYNLEQLSMFTANWFVLGSILPKDLTPRGDNLWASPFMDLHPSLQRYLLCDTAQPVLMAWVLVAVWTIHRFPDFAGVSEITQMTPTGLLQWVTEKVFKERGILWRKFHADDNNMRFAVEVIPAHDTSTVTTYQQLLNKTGIPNGPIYDIFRLDPNWPAVTAGGPLYLHTVRAFLAEIQPMLCLIDPVAWPHSFSNRLEFVRLRVPVDQVKDYPNTTPHSTNADWEANPGIRTLFPPSDLNALNRAWLTAMHDERGPRVLLIELCKLDPPVGRSVLHHLENNPTQFSNLVGKDRYQKIAHEMRQVLLLHRVDLQRPDGWEDPLHVQRLINLTKMKAAGHLTRQLQDMARQTDAKDAVRARILKALEAAKDPNLQDTSNTAIYKALPSIKRKQPTGHPSCSYLIDTSEGLKAKKTKNTVKEETSKTGLCRTMARMEDVRDIDRDTEPDTDTFNEDMACHRAIPPSQPVDVNKTVQTWIQSLREQDQEIVVQISQAVEPARSVEPVPSTSGYNRREDRDSSVASTASSSKETVRRVVLRSPSKSPEKEPTASRPRRSQNRDRADREARKKKKKAAKKKDDETTTKILRYCEEENISVKKFLKSICRRNRSPSTESSASSVSTSSSSSTDSANSASTSSSRESGKRSWKKCEKGKGKKKRS